VNLYILSFPTANITWVYDFKNAIWSRWSTWDLAKAKHNLFQGVYSVYAKGWNKHLMMSHTGDIFTADRNTFSDDGGVIRSSVRTGWIDHGTWDRKRSDQLIIKLKGYNPVNAKLTIFWRSDGFPEWSNGMELSVVAGTQNDHYVKLNRMGMYRSRQYEFVMTDAADLSIVGMEEDVTRMRN
jgi:hypothetical protein